MCTPENPQYVPQWEEWAQRSRTGAQAAAAAVAAGNSSAQATLDEFDTTITGPWMTAWPIVHQNRHTRALNGGQV
jgi:hypothetical protein